MQLRPLSLRPIVPPLLIALGLASRSRAMPEWVLLYVGDVLWGAFFYSLYACARSYWSPRRVWLAAVATTELIELSQLYRAPWAERVRATRLGALLFGRQFLWSDVVCVAVGASVAAVVHALAQQSRTRSN